MSVWIKGMEMPESCLECPCMRHDNLDGSNAYQCNVELITFGKEDMKWIAKQRPSWCPLHKIKEDCETCKWYDNKPDQEPCDECTDENSRWELR